MGIKNIIFDLGGVIIDIDYNKTLEAFRQLGAVNIADLYTQAKQDSTFDDFDTGRISAAEFRWSIKEKLGLNIDDTTFDIAWNAMLLDLPKDRLEYIKSLRAQGYRVFLFSNINEIHFPAVFQICKCQTGYDNFDAIFDRQYYSHLLGQRKPNVAAFHTVLEENDLIAEETLFLDDSAQHIEGAKQAGIHTVFMTQEKSIFGIPNFIKYLSSKEEVTLNVANSMMLA